MRFLWLSVFVVFGHLCFLILQSTMLSMDEVYLFVFLYSSVNYVVKQTAKMVSSIDHPSPNFTRTVLLIDFRSCIICKNQSQRIVIKFARFLKRKIRVSFKAAWWKFKLLQRSIEWKFEFINAAFKVKYNQICSSIEYQAY